MNLSSRLNPLALAAVLALLCACKPQPPSTPPQPTSDAAPQVTPSADLKGASDHADAPPAVGAMTAGQATGGARSGGTMAPTAGDRASGPASAASS